MRRSLFPFILSAYVLGCSTLEVVPETKKFIVTMPDGTRIQCTIQTYVTQENIGEAEKELMRSPNITGYDCETTGSGYMHFISNPDPKVDVNGNGVVDIGMLAMQCPSNDGPREMKVYIGVPTNDAPPITLKQGNILIDNPNVCPWLDIPALTLTLENAIYTGMEHGMLIKPSSAPAR